MPPGWRDLRQLNEMLKEHANQAEKAAHNQLRGADDEMARRGATLDDGVRDRIRDAFVELTGEQLP